MTVAAEYSYYVTTSVQDRKDFGEVPNSTANVRGFSLHKMNRTDPGERTVSDEHVRTEQKGGV